MDRPTVFCHMMTSLDGKIMGSYMDTAEGEKAGDLFYKLAFGPEPYYEHQGWLSGRITTDDNFTFYEQPNLDETAEQVPEGDFIADADAAMYYISVDPNGKLGWKSNTLTYIDTTAHVIEVLTDKASNAYKAFLRKLNISYIIVGHDTLDYELLMSKLKHLFNIKNLMLGGGGVLNWSFIQAGMCDEISIVMTSAADGSSDTPSLFETRGGLANDKPVSFTLKHAKVIDNSLWLRYTVNQ